MPALQPFGLLARRSLNARRLTRPAHNAKPGQTTMRHLRHKKLCRRRQTPLGSLPPQKAQARPPAPSSYRATLTIARRYWRPPAPQPASGRAQAKPLTIEKAIR
jgi:hypothetical protein